MNGKTRAVRVGGVWMGGGYPVPIQSMTNTKTADALATAAQINALAAAGCDIVRVAVPDEAAARAVYDIKCGTEVPLVADIHFDYRLALLCVERGIDKIRINPGNIGDAARVREVAKACRARGVPIRIGVNYGSIEKDLKQAYIDQPERAMVESARRHIAMLEACDFEDIVVSLKASDVRTTVQANRLMAQEFSYPLHLGVTEAGTFLSGAVKSAMGIGSLLLDGIGDTIRVSLTADPAQEVRVAREILKAAGKMRGLTIVSCPTCGRCRIDLVSIADRVEQALAGLDADLKVAVMGCAVNGPGEASDADIGIAGGNGEALLFKRGQIVRKIPEGEIVSQLVEEVRRMAAMSAGNIQGDFGACKNR